MSAPGRPKRESFEREREDSPISAPGRPKRETFEREREDSPAGGPGFEQPVSGPAYGRFFRVVATAMLLAVLAMAARAALQAPVGTPIGDRFGILGLGLFALGASYWMMIRATTTIDDAGIRQSGLIETKVTWSEVYSARLFGPPFARRLLVRTINGRFRFFFGGTPELHAAFARIVQRFRT
jgi:hypothetical protein